jgi:peptide deformylase
MLKKILSLIFKTPPPILRAGHPMLRAKATFLKPSDFSSKKLEECVSLMKAAFASKLTPVIGMAAPQVGIPMRLIAYQIKDDLLLKEHNLSKPVELTFLVNPVITSSTGSEAGYEFCESIPQYSGVVKRNQKITVDALDLDGNLIKNKKYEGLLARVIQHEVDHLEGRCFVDVMERGSFRHDKYLGKFDINLK